MTLTTRLSIFPLAGALLFPRMHLPLHIFEPRYRAMVSDAMARDRRIGMIQPRATAARGRPAPDLFDLGCVGRIAEVEALDDGRYNIVLEGLSLFRIVRELDVTTPFRQVEAELLPDARRARGAVDRAPRRARNRIAPLRRCAGLCGRLGFGRAARRRGAGQRHRPDRAVRFAAKQALLEAPDLSARAELIVQLMQFFGRHDGEDRVTLQ